MRRTSSAVLVALLGTLLLGTLSPDHLSRASARPSGSIRSQLPPKPKGSFDLVGHNPLMNRGMNAALAIHGNYAYVGSRTDGLHPNAGIMVVDISDPKAPEVAGQIGMPHAANHGETTRELRVWPEKDLLIVLNLRSNCSALIHACSPTQMTGEDTFRFFDISGKKAAAPELVAEYTPSSNPHEFFLWDDPTQKGRALLYISTPGGGQTQLLVTDISDAAKGRFTEVAEWSTQIPDSSTDNRLHSLTVSADGTRGYVAYLGGGFLVIDTSELAAGVKKPEVRAITLPQDRAHWGDPGAHSAIKIPGKPYALVTDEVYGEIPVLLADHGCPWGWTRIVDIRNPAKPKVKAHYRIEQNRSSYCDEQTENTPERNSLSSYAAHNPTLAPGIGLITWHSGGLQAVSLKNPRKPYRLAEFKPEPLVAVTQEDPALSSGRDKVVMWSFPIVKDGLVYVVDLRNGLYVLDYKGPGAKSLSRISFLEGNSNLGAAQSFKGY